MTESIIKTVVPICVYVECTGSVNVRVSVCECEYDCEYEYVCVFINTISIVIENSTCILSSALLCIYTRNERIVQPSKSKK